MPEQKYKRLTRERGTRELSVAFSARSSLWLGDDHVLLVESAFFAENYKRFFFRDIQAITLRKTDGRAICNWILGGMIFLSLLFTLIIPHRAETVNIVLACIASVIFGIPLLLNNLFGPTCACQIRTAVQTENLPSIRRVRQAHKIFNKVRPLIAAAQGQITPEEVNARMQAIGQTAPSTETPAFTSAAPPVIS